jgi:hypothetical protein
MQNPNKIGKNDAHESLTWFAKESKVHARPAVRRILIAKKLKRWLLIAQYPFVDRTCSPGRARRNYRRLCQRYPDIMAELKLTELAVYDPI